MEINKQEMSAVAGHPAVRFPITFPAPAYLKPSRYAVVVPAEPAPPPSIEVYRAALAAHDWFHGYSDDHAAYGRGRESLTRLSALQCALDPDYALWNQFAPAEFKLGSGA